MKERIETTLEDHVFFYDTDADQWGVELFGKTYLAPTLSEARKFICTVKPPKKDFQRFEAWYPTWGGEKWEVVTVTSDAGTRNYDKQPEVWIVNAKKQRSKTAITNLRAKNPKNDVFVEELGVLEQEMVARRKHRDKIKDYLMDPCVIP